MEATHDPATWPCCCLSRSKDAGEHPQSCLEDCKSQSGSANTQSLLKQRHGIYIVKEREREKERGGGERGKETKEKRERREREEKENREKKKKKKKKREREKR